MNNELKLIQMNNVQSEEVRWLWYPYIPLGKLTIVQGGMARAESKTAQMENALRELLEDGVGIPSDELTAYAESLGISERTLKIAKKSLGVVSERRGGKWYSMLLPQEGKGVSV